MDDDVVTTSTPSSSLEPPTPYHHLNKDPQFDDTNRLAPDPKSHSGPTPCSFPPPEYHPYASTASTTPYPEFPKNAITLALRKSAPPQVPSPYEHDRLDRIEAMGEQRQYYGSIRYGDQLNRGVDELGRFREDWKKEVAETTGLTEEEIEKRRMFLGCWRKGGDSDEEEEGCQGGNPVGK